MDRTTKYAKMVTAGETPAGKLVKLACRRHLDDLKQSKNKSFPYYFDKETAEVRLAFYGLCCHYKGDMAATFSASALLIVRSRSVISL